MILLQYGIKNAINTLFSGKIQFPIQQVQIFIASSLGNWHELKSQGPWTIVIQHEHAMLSSMSPMLRIWHTILFLVLAF